MANARIVVAEDESIIRMDLVEMLTEMGHQVVGQASDGKQALALVAEHRPDLVLLDISMPRLDGLQTIEAMRQIGDPAVIMVTAFGQDAFVQRAVAAGALGYVVKPFTAADLAPVVAVALARHAELVSLQAAAETAQDRLAARVVIERAKGHLQSAHGMSEEEAFGLLRRRAMDERTSMMDVAQRILDGAGL
jgi:AmiR/NasT family two-component response regulator